MIDNFEYWDSPYNHGWKQVEPFYPVYGYGVGYGQIFRTLFDFQIGNRVMDIYRPASVFLLNTPFARLAVYYDLYTPPFQDISSKAGYIDMDTHPIISYKFRAPVGVELWDIFQLDILGSTRAGYDITLQIRPLQPPAGSPTYGGNSTDNMGGYLPTILNADTVNRSIIIQVDIGRNYLDGVWHVVWLDLKEVVQRAFENYSGSFGALNQTDWEITKAERIIIRGQMFRMDNICFRMTDHSRIDQPDFFECGQRFAQIFEPYRFLFMADYEAFGDIKMFSDLLFEPENFITDPNQVRETWISDLLRLDPNYHLLDPNHPQYSPGYTNRWIPGDPNFGLPDPVAQQYIRHGFFIDTTLPLFSDPNFRIGGNRLSMLLDHGILGWNMTVGGYGENAIDADMIYPLPIDPYDGMPTYIPGYYRTQELLTAFGKNHYGPVQCFMLESALWNSGVSLWPNIIYMDYEPQYFEDLIVTLQVTNGHNSDLRIFPISVINYPVENYPPVVQLHTTNRITYVGETDEYALRFADPDCFIFSMAQFEGRIPSTTHLPMLPGNEIRTDQDTLTYRMTMDGAPVYQHGPWMQSMINPQNGLITITPAFEGAFEVIITCTDVYGYYAVGDFTYYTFNKGTWLNHPPISFGNPTRPVIARAGEEILLNYPDFKVLDPDGDELFVTANLGAVGRTSDGGFLWTYQTNFPGTYRVEVMFFDIRGGYLIVGLTVEVKPWWSY